MREDLITVLIQTHLKRFARLVFVHILSVVFLNYLSRFQKLYCSFSFFFLLVQASNVQHPCRITLFFIMKCWKRDHLCLNIEQETELLLQIFNCKVSIMNLIPQKVILQHQCSFSLGFLVRSCCLSDPCISSFPALI